MTLGTLTVQDVADYLKIESDDLTVSESAQITAMLAAARSYIVGQTGRTAEDLEQYPDIAIAALCLTGDFYNNRDMFTNIKGTGIASVNRTVDSIIEMYRHNLLPTPEEDEDVQP